jgi:hypothetical protein
LIIGMIKSFPMPHRFLACLAVLLAARAAQAGRVAPAAVDARAGTAVGGDPKPHWPLAFRYAATTSMQNA